MIWKNKVATYLSFMANVYEFFVGCVYEIN